MDSECSLMIAVHPFRVTEAAPLAFDGEHPRLDPECTIAPASDLVTEGTDQLLSAGHIALQAEGQPVWFRNIEILPLAAE